METLRLKQNRLHRLCRIQRSLLMTAMIYTSPHSIAHTMQSIRVGYFDCLLSKEKGDLNNPAVLAKVSVWACNSTLHLKHRFYLVNYRFFSVASSFHINILRFHLM